MVVSLTGVRCAQHVNVGQVGIVRLNVSLQLVDKRAMRLSGVGQRLRRVCLGHPTNYADLRPSRLGQRLAAVDPQCHTGHEGVGHREQHRAGNVVGSDSPRRVLRA
jgi:hypothetical protein